MGRNALVKPLRRRRDLLYIPLVESTTHEYDTTVPETSAAKKRNWSVYFLRGFIWLLIAAAAWICFIEGLRLHRWVFDITDPIRFNDDIHRGCYWGLKASGSEGISINTKNAHSNGRIGRTGAGPLARLRSARLLVMREWGVWLARSSSAGNVHAAHRRLAAALGLHRARALLQHRDGSFRGHPGILTPTGSSAERPTSRPRISAGSGRDASRRSAVVQPRHVGQRLRLAHLGFMDRSVVFARGPLGQHRMVVLRRTRNRDRGDVQGATTRRRRRVCSVATGSGPSGPGRFAGSAA